jgi:hypothetical protein
MWAGGNRRNFGPLAQVMLRASALRIRLNSLDTLNDLRGKNGMAALCTIAPLACQTGQTGLAFANTTG